MNVQHRRFLILPGRPSHETIEIIRSEGNGLTTQEDGRMKEDKKVRKDESKKIKSVKVIRKEEEPLMIDLENVCLMCGINSRTIGR